MELANFRSVINLFCINQLISRVSPLIVLTLVTYELSDGIFRLSMTGDLRDYEK